LSRAGNRSVTLVNPYRHYLRNIDIEAYRRFEDSIEDGESYFRTLIDRHKQRLEQLGIAQHRIAADVKAFEDHFFDNAA
jgi:hypothetical protein